MKPTVLPFRAGFLLGAWLLAFHLPAAAAPRSDFLAAKQAATDANYRNDQAGLRAALASFAVLETNPDLGRTATYHAAWTEWLLSASLVLAKQPAEANAALESAARRLRHLLVTTPDDAEAHSLLVFTLLALANASPARWPELATELTAHRRRAIELAPGNPRVLIMDATLAFFSRQPDGQARGIARWLEAQRLFETERIADPLQPDWGRTLADGWLANLYLAMTPPRDAEARALVDKVLRERPDYWWVATQVRPKLGQP